MDWIKVMCSLLDHRKIKMIRKGPEGNTLVLLWLLMLTEAGKSNRGGYLMVSDSLPYTAETLGMVTDIPLPTVHLALKTFAALDMIDQEDGAIFIKNWGKYQSEDKLEARRENDRKRQQRHRQNERQKLLVGPQQVSRDGNANMSRNVTTENREDNKEETTTIDDIQSLLSCTPLSKVLSSELVALRDRYGLDQLVRAADIAAETWRRNKEEITNPGGYLRVICSSLMVPGWYVPAQARKALSQTAELKRQALEEERRELLSQEESEAAVRNALWESLTDEARAAFRSEALAEIPAGLAPSMSIAVIAMAKVKAWQQATRSQGNRVGYP